MQSNQLSLFLSKMIAKLEKRQRTTPQNEPNTKHTHTMGAKTNDE